MRVFAHRGDHRVAPENTMQAFHDAQAAGVDGIETDLRHTRDGIVAIYHDHSVAGVPVSELSHRELVDLAGVPVPTLDDVFAGKWRLTWNLEIKTDLAYELARPAIAAWRGEVLVTSFLHDVAMRAAHETGKPGGLLIAHRPARGTAMPLPSAGVDTLVWDWKVADADALRLARAAGWVNAAYGTVGVAEHRLARELGIATLITDHISQAVA